MRRTISNSFIVTTVEDGESAPYYFQEMFAWSNDASTADVTTAPTLPSGHTWENSIPDSYATYLWCQSTRFVWNESTREYTQNGVEYYRKSGTNGTSITPKGSLPYAYASFPPNTAENIGKLAIIQGDGRIYKCQTTQAGTIEWISTKTSADGDSYTVESGNFDGNYQSQNVLGGHFVMWSAEANKWLDLGVFKGENGVTYYTHIVWATNVVYSGSTITSIEGYATVKSPSDTTHLWMGTYVDRNSADPTSGSDAVLKRYTWSYTKGVDGQSAFVADLSNENDSIACDSNGVTIAPTNIYTYLSVFYGTQDMTQYCQIKYTSKPAYTTLYIQESDSGASGTTLYANTFVDVGNKRYLRLYYPANVSVATNDALNLTIQHATYGTIQLKMTIASIKGGATYRLLPSTTAVSRKENGTLNPVTVSCTAEKIDALTGNVTSSPAEVTVKYTKDGGSTQYTYNGALTAGTDFTNSVQFLLLLGSNIVDRETVPVVRDGANGNDAVKYELIPSKNVVTLNEYGTPKFDVVHFVLHKSVGANTPVEYSTVQQWDAQGFMLYYVLGNTEYAVSYSYMESLDSYVNYHDIEYLYENNDDVSWIVRKNNTVIARMAIGKVSDGSTGARGKVGRFFYFGGVFDAADKTQTFIVNDAQAPYFEHSETITTQSGTTTVKRYHVFNYDTNGTYTMAQMWAISSNWNNKPWESMTNDFKYIITEALFGKYAHLGSFVINGDWMISTNGTIDGTEYTNGANATVDGETKVAYTFFDVAHPSENNNGKNFVPNLAIDARTGAGHLAKGNIVFNTNGDVTVQNAIVKGSLMYRKVMISSAATSVRGATLFKMWDENGYEIAFDDYTRRVSKMTLECDTFIVTGARREDFTVFLPPAKFFQGATIKIVNGTFIKNAQGQKEVALTNISLAVVYREETEMMADDTSGLTKNNFTSGVLYRFGYGEDGEDSVNLIGAPDSSKLTSYSQTRDIYGFPMANDSLYSSVELVSTLNKEAGDGTYYAWMIVDAR